MVENGPKLPFALLRVYGNFRPIFGHCRTRTSILSADIHPQDLTIAQRLAELLEVWEGQRGNSQPASVGCSSIAKIQRLCVYLNVTTNC
jgi:hypothetical protein